MLIEENEGCCSNYKTNPVKYLVTYYSQTGNTRKVAEAIFNAIPGDKMICPISEVGSLDDFGLTFLGFPVMQSGPPAQARDFIATHCAGKRIALFITHAMPSDSENPAQSAMLDTELEKCRSACSKSELAGLFHCQGELSEQIAEKLRSSGIPMLMTFAGMRPSTMGHPDPGELEAAAVFTLSLVEH